MRLTRCRLKTILVRGDNFLGLPTFMWPRDDFAGTVARVDPQPAATAHGMTATATKAQRPGYDRVMIVAAVVGVLIASAAFVRDLIAG